MSYLSSNPATGEINQAYPSWSVDQLTATLDKNRLAQYAWAETDFRQRSQVLRNTAALLRRDTAKYSVLITTEMGKITREARAEIERCALVCEYYADHAEGFLKAEIVSTEATKSYVRYDPLGVVLAVMPWNFPFWQVFRFAAPALMAGNSCFLKHAANVPRCALAIESLFIEAGLPQHVFSSALIDTDDIPRILASPFIQAVTVTGSERAGRSIATTAGENLKKCVLELGGSDPFIVLRDADIDLALQAALLSRYQNCGQSCIAAKRFILVPEIADDFVEALKKKVVALRIGDPTDENTDIGPMARPDLVEALHRQVTDSIAHGALPITGCYPLERLGWFYAPSILDRVTSAARAFHEELFGPVAAIIRVSNEEQALRTANDTRYGLASSIWSRDSERAESIAMNILAGAIFINGVAKSDFRLPFGGIKASGYGRELSYHGIREFVNTKTVWIR